MQILHHQNQKNLLLGVENPGAGNKQSILLLEQVSELELEFCNDVTAQQSNVRIRVQWISDQVNYSSSLRNICLGSKVQREKPFVKRHKFSESQTKFSETLK